MSVKRRTPLRVFAFFYSRAEIMTPEQITLLLQAPLVGIFAYIVLAIMQRYSTAAKDNHAEWRMWLTNDRETWLKFAESQNQFIATSINNLDERINLWEGRHAEQTTELLRTLERLNASAEALSRATEKISQK